MNSKTFWAALLGGITHFFLGFLIYGLLLMNFMQAEMTRFEGLFVEGDIMIVGHGISSLLLAVLITFVSNKDSNSSARSGMLNGALLSLLMALSINFIWYFSSNLASELYYVVDSLAFTLLGAGSGLVIGAVLSRSRARAAATASVA